MRWRGESPRQLFSCSGRVLVAALWAVLWFLADVFLAVLVLLGSMGPQEALRSNGMSRTSVSRSLQ